MASNDLNGRTALVIVTNYGVEQDELLAPVAHLRDHGATVDVAAATGEPVQTLVGDKDPGEKVEPTTTLEAADPSAYDLLVLPGGTLNADQLRQNADAVAAVRSFTSTGRPIAAICHGPWTLIDAGVAKGRTLTSYPSLRIDLQNAGATVVDREVVIDGNVISSRGPDDLPAFSSAVVDALARGA